MKIAIVLLILTSGVMAQDAPFDAGTALVIAGSRLEGANSYYGAVLQEIPGTRWMLIAGLGVQTDSDENGMIGTAYRISRNVYIRYDFNPLLKDNDAMQWNRHVIGMGLNGTFNKVFDKIGIGLPELDFLIDVGVLIEDEKESQSRISFGLVYDF